MQHGLHAFLAVLFVTAVSGCATTDEGAATSAAAPSAEAIEVVEQADGSLAAADATIVTATVVAVDPTTRMVTLRGSDGNEITFRAGDEVRNLAQVKPGDIVEAAYYESVAIQVRKPGEATPGISAVSAAGRAEPGERPGAGAVRSITATSTIDAIDRDNRRVTLKAADGTLHTVPVRNPAHLEGVEVGDLVEITYTEALGISVEEPGME